MLPPACLHAQGLRFNSAEAVDAARRGALLPLLHARGRNKYAKIVVLDMCDYGPDPKFCRAPEVVCEERARFLCGGQSGELGHLQPLDLLHEESQRGIHLLGKSTSVKTSVGITATFDTSQKVRAACLRNCGLRERPLQARSTPPADIDLASMLAKLAGSSYLKPGGADGKRTEALDYAGNPLTANAHTLLDYGREGLEAYEKKVREGQWDSGKTRPRMAFFMEEEQHDELMRTRREARKKVQVQLRHVHAHDPRWVLCDLCERTGATREGFDLMH